EAATAEAIYGNVETREQRCRELLDRALLKHLYTPSLPYDFVDDRRDAAEYRVSVIVSLDNAADRLSSFLSALSKQTAIQAGTTEILLIARGSSSEEYAAFDRSMRELELPIVYARSPQPESIQQAWNRGVAMARSPYVTFLKIGESFLPNSLQILADALDADPTLDWVFGNYQVVPVDTDGLASGNPNVCDRTGYWQNLVYLDPDYLGRIGSLYRRSLHNRLGYYDTTFTTAGETEFIYRVLPFIKTKFVPHLSSIIQTRSKEQIDPNPQAELENLRARHLHLTLAGIQYAFQSTLPEGAETLFFTCMRYRKLRSQRWSTDIEYADRLAEFLRTTVPSSSVLKFHDGMKQLLTAYRSLDYIPKFSTLNLLKTVLEAKWTAIRWERKHRRIDPQKADPIYRIFNDNRYENFETERKFLKNF
ncbi:MAG: glycosyltransferase, partial [Cyanobacteriota bacterium]|nr:glycosyltransferase [Cyanobacteriota bacterium]